MTLQELANEVMGRLNLSASTSEVRVKRELNAAYRKVSSSIGLITSRRATASTNTVAGTATVTLALEKVERVYYTLSGQNCVLAEDTYENVRTCNLELATSGQPQRYAVQRMGAGSVTLILDPIPADVFTVTADGYENASTLGDSDAPAFPGDFHDVLVYDVIREERLKMEKPALAKQAESDYSQRLSDLRYFIIKSNSLAIVQGTQPRWLRLRPTWRY